MDELKQAALAALLTVLTAAVGVLATLLTTALGAWRRKLEQQAKESKLAQVGVRTSMLAEAVVRELEATLRPQLAKATADGKLTAEEREELRAMAMAQLRASLGQHGLEELQAVLGIAAGQLGVFLGGVIEASVAKMKVGQAITEAAPATATQPLVTDAMGNRVPLGPPMPLGAP